MYSLSVEHCDHPKASGPNLHDARESKSGCWGEYHGPIVCEPLHRGLEGRIRVPHLNEHRLALGSDTIRVVAPRKLPERRLERAVVRRRLDAEHLVVVGLYRRRGVVEGVREVADGEEEVRHAVVPYILGGARTGRRAAEEAGVGLVEEVEELLGGEVGEVGLAGVLQ